MPCIALDSDDEGEDDGNHIAGVCTEVCAAFLKEDDDRIIIGRRHPRSKITAPRNLLMPDEFTDSKTKDLREEIRKAEVGEDFVPTKIPRGYFQSEHFHKQSELERKVALRKAELLKEDLIAEKKETEYIVEDYLGQVYQILANYGEDTEFLSSTNMPSCDYQDYSDSIVEEPKSLEVKAESTTIKDRLSSDHWIIKEDGLLVRKHVVPRTNLYEPDFDHEPLKKLRIKETRITHVQYMTGRGEVITDQWSHPGENKIMQKWVGQTIFFVDQSIPKIQDSVCLCTQDVPSMPKGKWLLDTGCGHDLISQRMVGDGPVRSLDEEEIMSFTTANGCIKTEFWHPCSARNSRT
jgi:hypothetical protein